jgi:hypothetical protein
MGLGTIKCIFAFSTTDSSALARRLEEHASALDASYRESYLQWLLALNTLHDAVDAALADDSRAAERDLLRGRQQLAACNERLTAMGQALVELRSDLFDRGAADASEPLLARERFFAALDYDALYRELAGRGAALAHRTFWDETAARLRDGGARGGCRLLERHLRELQSDLHVFIADVEAAGRLPLRAMAEALHDTSIPVARVMTGYTRLITTFGYISFLCDRAMRAYEHAAGQASLATALAAG